MIFKGHFSLILCLILYKGTDFLCEISLIEKLNHIVQCTEALISAGRVQTFAIKKFLF